MATKEELQARLAAAAVAKVAIDEKTELEDLERKVILDELDVRLSKELGRRGEDYEIIDGGPDGPIALKLGASVGYKAYKAKVSRDKDTDEDLIAFVAPCVILPADLQQFHAMIGRRKHLLTKCGDALLTLYGNWEDRRRGK